jgi:hypothetical protein
MLGAALRKLVLTKPKVRLISEDEPINQSLCSALTYASDLHVTSLLGLCAMSPTVMQELIVDVLRSNATVRSWPVRALQAYAEHASSGGTRPGLDAWYRGQRSFGSRIQAKV